MIVTLPISHLIDADNLYGVSGVAALEYKQPRPPLTHKLPALFHSNLGIVQDGFMTWFDGALATLKIMNLRLLSFDCGPAARVVDTENRTYVARSEVLSRDSLISLITQRIADLRGRLKVPLAMENLNYYPASAYEHVCEPDFIASVVRATDMGFVLDIAHAIVSAHNMGVEVEAYISALPLERVAEVHLSSPGIRNDQWRDLHGSPTTLEYDLLASLLPNIPAGAYVAIEHYASYEAVVRDYTTLRRFLNERDDCHDGSRQQAGL